MALHLIEAFRNPVSRPRAIIWAGVVLILFIAFVMVAIAATSSFWFCAEGCHKVQDDAVAAYRQGSHNQVSCLSCHMPAGANPIVFMIHKVEAGVGELPITIANTFEVPLNPESKVALSSIEFPDTQCTQCHDMKTRKVTSSSGIIFTHQTHSDLKIRCTFCHNRAGHNENGLVLKGFQPKTGEKAYPHTDFMSMNGCFRCHSLEAGAVASGKCTFCHVEATNLVPANHSASDFLHRHGRLYVSEEKKVEEAEKETGQKTPTPASVQRDLDNLAAGKSTGPARSADFAWPIAPIATVNTCYTCHTKASCESCHEKSNIHFQL
ncbi:MAG: NapC/NirT family cytochrome c [Actinomycetia bacterium]|nr:NapC/NirT family cytochrome c [Actinomycetes bacterium]